MIQLLLHGLGDYLIQSDWMALNKKKKNLTGEIACQIHCITYALPFFLIGNYIQVFLIYITHYIIDRFHIIEWFLAIRNGVYHTDNFGYSLERPVVLTLWLYIITDNLIHLIFNYIILTYI